MNTYQRAREPLRTPIDGAVRYVAVSTAPLADVARGRHFPHREGLAGPVVVGSGGLLVVFDDLGVEQHRLGLRVGDVLLVTEGAHVRVGEILVERSPYSLWLLADVPADVTATVVLDGVVEETVLDDVTGLSRRRVRRSAASDGAIVLRWETGERRYEVTTPIDVCVSAGDLVHRGDVLGSSVRYETDPLSLGGQEGLAWFLEARAPARRAPIARVDGVVTVTREGSRARFTVTPDDGSPPQHVRSSNAALVRSGDRVTVGEPLTAGSRSHRELLSVLSREAFVAHLCGEIEAVFTASHVAVDARAIEVVVARMLSQVRVTDPGGTELFRGQVLDRRDWAAHNERARARGAAPSESRPTLVGISRLAREVQLRRG